MEERFIKTDDAELFVLSTELKHSRKNIVFVHGIGESLVCFSEAFRELPDFNIIALDIAGYGQSASASSKDLSTEMQSRRVLKVLDALSISKFVLVGHSWGGDIGTLMCKLDTDNRIGKYINIEGDLHRNNIFISLEVSKAFSKLDKEKFDRWLKASRLPEGFDRNYKESFPQSILKCGVASRAAALRYLVSLRLCDSVTFGETATEIAQQHKSARNDGVVKWGEVYASINIPTVYCWGTESIKKDSGLFMFLESNNILNKSFEGASHWVMIDSCREFYRFVRSTVTD